MTARRASCCGLSEGHPPFFSGILRELSLTVLRIQDEERRRVARDLHDTVGQTLTAQKLTLSALDNASPKQPQTAEFLVELNGFADQALQEIRSTSYLLHFSTSRVLLLPLPGTSTDLN